MTDGQGGQGWRTIVGFMLFTPEGTPRFSDNFFESVMMIVLVPLACWLAYRLYTRPALVPASGLVVGLVWIAISIALDIPTLILGFGMPWSEYAVDVALSYPAVAAITVAVAKAARARRLS
jgi:hypothetical protein